MAARVVLPRLGTPPSRRSDPDNHRNNNRAEDEDVPEEEEDDDEAVAARWEGRANFFVAVRLRPRVSLDRLAADEIVRVASACEVVVRTPLLSSADAVRPRPARKPSVLLPLSPVKRGGQFQERRFAYDRVFSPRDGQAAVYARTARSLIPGVLRGCNATVLAYGCTGAGKTFTMLGTPEDPGLMARALDDLFRRIARKVEASAASAASTVSFRVAVSFLEVYNETIRDLLSPAPASSSSSTAGLDLREDPVRGVATVAGLSEIEVRSAREVLALLRKGHRRRAQEATAANGASSRSHALLQVLVEQRTTTCEPELGEQPQADPQTSARASTTVVKAGKLSLVDLAGSERAAATQNRGLRLVEGANINRSLLALGNCINALADKSAGGSAAANPSSFVPYRDSKLTRLLKDALGGNCRTVLIANVSPSAASAEETVHTLQYAARARSIQTTVASNVVVWSTSSARDEVDGDADERNRSPRGRQEQHASQAGAEQEAAYAGVISDLRGEIDALRRALDDQQRADPTRSLGLTSRSPPLHKSPARAAHSVERTPVSPVLRGNNNDDDADDDGGGGDPEAIEPRAHGDRGHRGGPEGEALPSMDAQVHAARRIIAEAFATQRRCARELRAADEALVVAVHAARSIELPRADAAAGDGDLAAGDGDGDGDGGPAALLTPGASEDVEASVPEMLSPARHALALKHAREQAHARLAASDARLLELRRRVDALPAPPTVASPTFASFTPLHVPMSQSLVRELLLLEFRVGELEGDKLALELQCGGTDARRELHLGSSSDSDNDAWLSALEARFPDANAADRPPGISAAQETAAARDDDLVVERLVRQAVLGTADSSASPMATARRQWGIQVRNPSLPYIRRRKRPPPMGMAAGPALPTELPALLPSVSGRALGVGVGVDSGALPSTTLPIIGPSSAVSGGGGGGGALSAFTAPYLKVLKQRQHRQLRPRK